LTKEVVSDKLLGSFKTLNEQKGILEVYNGPRERKLTDPKYHLIFNS